jgi:hypothetical protein
VRGLRQSSLSIEAKIIYNMGGPQPVARTQFYLLDVDPFSIRADEPSFRKKMDAAKSEDERMVLLTGSAVFIVFKKVIEDHKITEDNAKTLLGSVEAGRPLWESHLVKELTTDFEGRGLFTGLKSGHYWLMGITETRSAFTLWNVPIQLARGENTLLLDQNNALYSK